MECQNAVVEPVARPRHGRALCRFRSERPTGDSPAGGGRPSHVGRRGLPHRLRRRPTGLVPTQTARSWLLRTRDVDTSLEVLRAIPLPESAGEPRCRPAAHCAGHH